MNKQTNKHKQINKKAFQYDAYCPLVDHIPKYPRPHVHGHTYPRKGPDNRDTTPPEMIWDQRYPPPCGQTDICEKITIRATSFGGGNKQWQYISHMIHVLVTLRVIFFIALNLILLEKLLHRNIGQFLRHHYIIATTILHFYSIPILVIEFFLPFGRIVENESVG